LDANILRDLLGAGLAWLDRHHEIVNALNVFPVPDGDTGTNMLLTMKSACGEITPDHLHSAGAVAKAAAHGALMGARGNSGVILSQILRGISRSLDDQPTITGAMFAAALAEGSRVAYKGVNRPVEGTILTVMREAAAAAESAATLDDDLRFIMARTVRAADEAVANTPKLLPVLAQAGKVDSGGKGLFFILEGMLRALTGEAAPVENAAAPLLAAPTAIEAGVPQPSKGQREIPPLVYGFDVQFLVEGAALDVAAIRGRITALGDCPLVEGDATLVKVHVHVPDPGVVLSYAVSLGFVTDVVVENMDDMHIPEMPTGYDPFPPRFEDGQTLAAPLSDRPETFGSIAGPGVVAVVPGAGLANVFQSLGTHLIIAGGQTMNPSTQDLLEAIRKFPVPEVILLPNNGNILMAAQQAVNVAETEGKTVRVVPSKSIPQGISALLALNPHGELEHNVAAMTAALGHVQTGEVTVAVHDAHFDGIQVRAGDVIGLLNDVLSATASTAAAVVQTLLEQMRAADLEVITLYYGQPVAAEEATGLQEALRQLYPDQEIEVVAGGQPFYHYIISAE
jgi:DAK2 domain fusion protein YloV